MTLMRASIIFSLLLLSVQFLTGQPMNDNCNQAIHIEEPGSWCSELGAFTIEDATPSGINGSCLNNSDNDVWFSFVPAETSVAILAIGSGGGLPLTAPAIALYEGNCNNLTELDCRSTFPFSQIVELLYDGLTPGQTYYIQVQGQANEGSFQLCTFTFNAPAIATSDCPEAAILCDKNPFIVPKIFGGGDDPTEANDAPCLGGFGGNVESSSTWFVWTAAEDGTLTFTLNPLNPTDDIDFVVYEFPNGPQDCSNKEPIRCMASSCEGATGLDEGSTDFEEPPNCSLPTQDNFLAALNMTEGTTYGLMVNNFSVTGIGFQLSFGGTAGFTGPEGDIAVQPANGACINEPFTLTDASFYPEGDIVGWEWDFGADASIGPSISAGPHYPSYSTPGTKLITLRLTTAQGCIITHIEEVEVICCQGFFELDANIMDTSCPDTNDGSINLNVSNPTGPPYDFLWEGGATTSFIDQLPTGDYTVTITDENACDTTITLSVGSPPIPLFDTLITMPSCNGGMNGAISLEPITGDLPLMYSWGGAPFTGNNSLSGLGIGDYEVSVQDANGCISELIIPLNELELILSPNVASIQPPSCTGDSDAQITVIIANGLPPYQYDFNDGNGYVSENILTQLTAGSYTVNVLDANLCMGNFIFEIEDPTPISFSFTEIPISCFGDTDGGISVDVSGGTGSYAYQWNNGSMESNLSNLPAGTYTLSITDDNDCMASNSFELIEPPLLEVSIEALQHILCYGETNGQITLLAQGGRSPYFYSIEGQALQNEPIFSNLSAGQYTLVLTDDSGCQASIDANITQPPALWVEITPVDPIALGYDALLRTQASLPALQYQWSPPVGLSCDDCPQPIVSPFQENWYTVEVMDESGCTASDSILIEVDYERPVFIPNAFSPNEDGRNDLFQLFHGPAVKQVLTLDVFDRWGSLIFQGENLSGTTDVIKWDGMAGNRKAPSGVYTYILEVEFIDGYKKIYSGNVHLVR